MNNKINDIICSGIFFAFGIFLLIITPMMTPAYKNDALGSRFFPYAIAVCTILVSMLQGAFAFIEARKVSQGEHEHYFIEWAPNFRTLLFCLSTVISVYMIHMVHFLVGALVMTTTMLLLIKEKSLVRYAIVYGCCVLAYFIFTYFLHIRI